MSADRKGIKIPTFAYDIAAELAAEHNSNRTEMLSTALTWFAVRAAQEPAEVSLAIRQMKAARAVMPNADESVSLLEHLRRVIG